jgi:hypothetical protein
MGIVSEPWGRGKGYCPKNRRRWRDRTGDRRPAEAPHVPGGPGARDGNHTRPTLRSRRGVGTQGAASRGQAHEVSTIGTGRAPGRTTATIRRHPTRHTGHRVRSTPVNRCRRAAPDSGGLGGGGGGTARSARHRASLARRPRFARTPKCRIRTKRSGRMRKGTGHLFRANPLIFLESRFNSSPTSDLDTLLSRSPTSPPGSPVARLALLHLEPLRQAQGGPLRQAQGKPDGPARLRRRRHELSDGLDLRADRLARK